MAADGEYAYPPPVRRAALGTLPEDTRARAVLEQQQRSRTLDFGRRRRGTRAAGFVALAVGACLTYLMFEFVGRQTRQTVFRFYDLDLTQVLGLSAVVLVGMTLIAATHFLTPTARRHRRAVRGDVVVSASAAGVDVTSGAVRLRTGWAGVTDWHGDDELIAVTLDSGDDLAGLVADDDANDAGHVTLGLTRAGLGEAAFVAWWDTLAAHVAPVLPVATEADVVEEQETRAAAERYLTQQGRTRTLGDYRERDDEP